VSFKKEIAGEKNCLHRWGKIGEQKKTDTGGEIRGE